MRSHEVHVASMQFAAHLYADHGYTLTQLRNLGWFDIPVRGWDRDYFDKSVAQLRRERGNR